MFGNIKRKLNDVISEGINISETLSNTYLHPSKSSVFDRSKANLGVPPDINLSAGCELLAKNERTWHALHANDEENARVADCLDKTIFQIRERTEKLQVDLNDMNACLVTIPQLLDTLKHCNEMVTNVGILCRSFDTKLAEFEDVTEEIQLQQRQLEQKFQMSLYKQKKMAQLESVRSALAKKYADNVARYENDLKKIQQERQAVFQDAFQHDLELYKQQGTIPKVEHVKKQSDVSELTLEEITLDDPGSNNELEDFLKD